MKAPMATVLEEGGVEIAEREKLKKHIAELEERIVELDDIIDGANEIESSLNTKVRWLEQRIEDMKNGYYLDDTATQQVSR